MVHAPVQHARSSKFADAFGFNEAYLQANQTGSFALETHVRYLNEVRVGRHITIRSRVLGRSAKRIHFMHFMTIDESGLLAAMQEHVGAHIDMSIRRRPPAATRSPRGSTGWWPSRTNCPGPPRFAA